MQLDQVAIGDEMLGAYLLAIEDVRAPHAGKLEAFGNVLVHEPRDIEHCAAATNRKWFVSLRFLARRLGVDADNLQRPEQEGADLVEAVAGLGRDRQGR